MRDRSLRLNTFTPALVAATLMFGISITSPKTAAAQEAGLSDTDAQAAIQKARAQYDSGQWDEALTSYEALIKAAGSQSVTAVEAAIEASSLRWERGEYAQATKTLEAALAQAKAMKLEAALGRLLLTMGHIETSQGKLSAANKTFKLCVELATEQHDAIYASLCRINHSLVQRLAGGKGLSDEAMQREIQTIKTANTPLSAGTALAKTGELYSKQGNSAQAISMLEQAQAQFESAKSVPAAARNRVKLAQALNQAQQLERANQELDRAIGPLKKMGHKPGLIQAYGLKGTLAQSQGKREEAYGYYDQSLKLARQIGSPQWIANSRLAICELLAMPPAAGQAEAHCQAASEDFGRIGAAAPALRARVKLAGLKQLSGSWSEAHQLYKSIITSMEKMPRLDAEETKVLAIQRANICQVEHMLEATGTMRTCNLAIDALTALPQAAQLGEYVTASHYAAGFGALREKRSKEALEHFEASTKGYIAANDALRAADSSLHLGTLQAKLKGKEAAAEATLNQGLTQLKATTATAQAQEIGRQLRLQLSQLLLEQGKLEPAKRELEALLASAAQDPDLQAWAYQGMASVLLKSQDKEGAIKALEQGIEAAKRGKDRYGLLDSLKQNLKQLKSP